MLRPYFLIVEGFFMSMYDFEVYPVLETERLILREIRPDDAVAWQDVFNHPDVMRYLIDFDTGETDLNEVGDIIKWAQDIFKAKSGFRLAITCKPDDVMIGSCGFHVYEKQHRSAEMGYELHRNFWRQGLMREAVMALLTFGFEAMNLHRIAADVTEGNMASAGLLKNVGFTQEGTWHDKVFSRGQFYDLWQFSMLEDKFRVP